MILLQFSLLLIQISSVVRITAMRQELSIQHKQHHLLLKQSISHKKIIQIQQVIVKYEDIKLPYIEWARYLTQIFAMLTDPDIQTPTFTRRVIVFRIFAIAIEKKMMELGEKQTPVHFRKNLELLIRIIATIFISTASRRNIQPMTIQSFHKCICKFLGSLSTNVQLNKNNQLQAQKIKILSKLYPLPTRQKSNTSQFIYPDLLLWYQFFIKIKNMLNLNSFEQNKAIQHLAKIRSQVQQNQQPILIWISIYTFLQQSIKIHLIYDKSVQIEELCIKIVKIMMKQICQKFTGFLSNKQRQQRKLQDYENFFKCMIRFNTVQLAYCQIQNIRKINKDDINIEGAIQQTMKTIKVILIRCSEEKNKLMKLNLIGQLELYSEKVLKYQCLLQWIFQQLQTIQRKFFHDRNDNDIKNKQFLLLHINPQETENLHKANLLVNTSNFEKLIIKNIAEDRENLRQKFSDGRRISDLVIYASYLLSTNPQSFKKSIDKVLQPLQSMNFYLSLIAQYNINNRDLILISILTAQQVLQQQLQMAEQIKTEQKIKIIKNSISLISLSIQKTKKLLCNYCASIQSTSFCQICNQACIKFIYPAKMPIDMNKYWWEYINMKDYFINNDINRVPESYKYKLVQAFTAFTDR